MAHCGQASRRQTTPHTRHTPLSTGNVLANISLKESPLSTDTTAVTVVEWADDTGRSIRAKRPEGIMLWRAAGDRKKGKFTASEKDAKQDEEVEKGEKKGEKNGKETRVEEEP
ncbi:hypothetical protein WN51_10237 [Melipona quadrifasciata]|uniref:Uncharacterized protein n=1 Tax=Melipona quadrifasciata TaxID=166423 RepID=A0A0M9A4M9_9HYME|nr:hypothetical protein WN51_10237 [Melipona quadrifasciata]